MAATTAHIAGSARQLFLKVQTLVGHPEDQHGDYEYEDITTGDSGDSVEDKDDITRPVTQEKIVVDDTARPGVEEGSVFDDFIPRDKNGRTPLSWAAERGYVVVRLHFAGAKL